MSNITIRQLLKRVRRQVRMTFTPREHMPKTGRKGFRKDAIATALILGFLRGIVTIRGLERYLLDHKAEARLCNLKDLPSDTTIGRMKNWLSPEMLEDLLNRTIRELIRHLGRVFCIAVDCTPLEAYRKKKEEDARWGYSTTKGWSFGYKIHIAVDAIRGLPIAVMVTSGNKHGLNYLPALLRKVGENGIRFHIVVADSGYDGETNHRVIIEEFRAIPIIKQNERNTTALEPLPSGFSP